METFKTALVFGAVCAVFYFNLKLYSDKQGVLLSSTLDPGGWHYKCRYYAPVRTYYVKQPVQTGCSDYAPFD